MSRGKIQHSSALCVWIATCWPIRCLSHPSNSPVSRCFLEETSAQWSQGSDPSPTARMWKAEWNRWHLTSLSASMILVPEAVPSGRCWGDWRRAGMKSRGASLGKRTRSSVTPLPSFPLCSERSHCSSKPFPDLGGKGFVSRKKCLHLRSGLALDSQGPWIRSTIQRGL